MLSGWVSPKVWDCLANCTFPAFPASIGENSSLLHYQELDHLGGSTNNNASWAEKAIGNRIFSSSHSFPKKTDGFLRLLCFNTKS